MNNGNGQLQHTNVTRLGEKTKKQSRALRGDMVAAWCGLSGYDEADKKFPPTYSNYELMSSNPTLALAKAVKISPILAASWSWKVKSDIPNGEAIKTWVQEVFDPHRFGLYNEMARALEYGSQTMEIVWETRIGVKPGVPNVRYEPKKFKPLNPHLTRVLIDQPTGKFDGITNAGVILSPNEVLHYVFDMRNGNWYGRPLHENVRREFWEFKQDGVEAQKLSKKLSGIIPIAKVLAGMAKNPDTNEPVDRYDIMLKVIQGLASAKGVVFESVLFDEGDLRANPELLKVSDVDLEVLDLGSTTPALAAMLDKRKNSQMEFMQGWLLPPRTALEAQYGSRADAEEQGDVGEVHTELLHHEQTIFINKYAVNRMLELNLGPAYRDAVYAVPAPIRDRNRAVLKQILTSLMANSATVEMVLSILDDEAVLKQLNLPIRKEPLPVALPQSGAPDQPVPAGAAAAIGKTFANTSQPIKASRQTEQKEKRRAASSNKKQTSRKN